MTPDSVYHLTFWPLKSDSIVERVAFEIASHLSKLLPQVVDKLAPEGKIPQGDIMSQGVDLLKNLLK